MRSTARNVSIQKRKVYYIKIKVITLEETNPFAIEICISKNGTSVSVLLLESLADKFVKYHNGYNRNFDKHWLRPIYYASLLLTKYIEHVKIH